MSAVSRDPSSAPGPLTALAQSEPSWAAFLQAQSVDAHGLDERRRQIDHHILRDGVTHNVHADGATAMRPWTLEVLPHLIHPEEWQTIEAGVRQRAALLQALMHDAYGPQQLLRQGLLPGALLWRHPGYLRPLRGVVPALGLWLHTVAFDLTRDPQGRWVVLAQRTQAPSGLGYVLHNRLLIARTFPEAFEQMRVQHIASSYQQALSTLQAAAAAAAAHAGTPTKQPRVVLWTPGPYSETHFEQAYLARYLGLPLVEGGDLTVRAQRLYLKTVHGLEPVHGVLRRLDDPWLDPLELRADSQLGVPGLLQVLRAGHVAMANAPGAGWLESPALHGFLPGMARALGEPELLLPSVDSWWCGEESARQAVEAAWPALRIRRTFPQGARTSELLPPNDATFVALQEDPDGFVAQQMQSYGPAPVWGHGVVHERPSMVRVYALADGQGGWAVLPGGMTRVSRADHGSLSMQRGGASLDTWVLTTGAVDTYSRLRRRLTLTDLQEAVRPVASRTGENLFWLGRYTERIEQSLPLLRLGLRLCSEAVAAPVPLQHTVSLLVRNAGLVPWDTPQLHQSQRVFERALWGHAFRSDGQSGALGPGFSLQALLKAAQQLRERLSTDHWALVQAAVDTAASVQASTEGLHAVLAREVLLTGVERLSLLMGAITGAQTDRMTRDHGWRLLTLGRLVERLATTGWRLQTFLSHGALESEAGWDALLELSDSVITFRARHQRQTDLLALADVLVFDDTNPRALAGVLRRLRTEIGKLPGEPVAREALLRLLPVQGVGAPLAAFVSADHRQEQQVAAHLAALSASLAQVACDLADGVGARYFTPAHALEVRV